MLRVYGDRCRTYFKCPSGTSLLLPTDFFFYKGPVIFIIPTTSKLHLTPAVSLLYSQKLCHIAHKLHSGSFEEITGHHVWAKFS